MESRCEIFPEKVYHQRLGERDLEQIIDSISSYLDTFRDNGQPGANIILCYILHQVITKLITRDNLKFVVQNEPESKQNKDIMYGDILVLLETKDATIPVLIAEFSVMQPTQLPAQLLHEIKLLYGEYHCNTVTAVVVYTGSTYKMQLITFDDASRLNISHHTTITPLSVSLSRSFIVEREAMIRLLQNLYGLLAHEVQKHQQPLETSLHASPPLEK